MGVFMANDDIDPLATPIDASNADLHPIEMEATCTTHAAEKT
jgi:hypothetical protein